MNFSVPKMHFIVMGNWVLALHLPKEMDQMDVIWVEAAAQTCMENIRERTNEETHNSFSNPSCCELWRIWPLNSSCDVTHRQAEKGTGDETRHPPFQDMLATSHDNFQSRSRKPSVSL
jgi:hypothetical protein